MKRRHTRIIGAALALALGAISAAPAFAQSTPSASPVAVSDVAATATFNLPGDAVFPEGVAYRSDVPGLEDRFFVGSTTDGTIFSVDLKSGKASVFSAGGADGRIVAVGMKLDAAGHLIVVGGPTNMVFVYDARSGAFIRSFMTTPNVKTFLNDVTVTPSGDAYITDSYSPNLYRIEASQLAGPDSSGGATPVDATPAAAEKLDPWLDLNGSPIVYGDGFNLNGIAASADGASLLTVQTNTGKLFRIDIASKAVTEIAVRGHGLKGGDGMALEGSTLFVVHGIISVVQIDETVGAPVASILADIKSASLSSPTTAAAIGSCLLVVNSQFANQQSGKPTLPFTLSLIPVPDAGSAPGGATPVAAGC
ncbi:MAG: SMP-30/gluconolactonase/LRE family protein [Thermomicrobiales bacterium]